MKKVLIDARMYGLQHAGIGRYEKNLIDRLVSNQPPFLYHLILHPSQQERFDQREHVKVIPCNVRHYTLKEQVVIPQIINQYPCDLIHFPHFNVPLKVRSPFVVTIHDILWHQFKGAKVTTLNPLQYGLKYQGYKLTVKRAVTKAQRILVPSLWVKNQLSMSYPKINPNHITVTYEGVDSNLIKPTNQDKSQSLLKEFNLKTPFLVYTGSAYPHKNLKLLFHALQKLNRDQKKPLQLAIISARDVFLDELKVYAVDHHLEQQIKFLGFVEDEQLPALYSQALALVHPSLSEGFGLTGLEAMANGLPVVAAKATALPEIYGQAALYFNPHDVDELVHQIKKILADSKLRSKLIQKGKQQINQFSWDKTVSQTVGVYRQCLE